MTYAPDTAAPREAEARGLERLREIAAKATPGPLVPNDLHDTPFHQWRLESDATGYPNDGCVLAMLEGPDAGPNARLFALTPHLLPLAEALAPFMFGDPTMEQILWGDQPDSAKVTIVMSLGKHRQARAAWTAFLQALGDNHG